MQLFELQLQLITIRSLQSITKITVPDQEFLPEATCCYTFCICKFGTVRDGLISSSLTCAKYLLFVYLTDYLPLQKQCSITVTYLLFPV